MGHREIDLSYIGGFFDGEGTITIGRLKPKPHVYGGLINTSYTLRFQIAQGVDNGILQWCRDLVGYGSIHGNYSNRGFYREIWQAGGKTAYTIIKVLQPYVHIKRAQIELAIFFQETSKWSIGGHAETKPEETARRDIICQAIQCLNQSMGRVENVGELLGYPIVKNEDNQQPSQVNVVDIVTWKVQRLTGEEPQTNNPDTSAHPEREDIVRAV